MKHIVALTTLIFFTTAAIPAIAEEGGDEGDYVEVEQGEPAPYSGYLFDHGGVAGLIARHDKELEQLTLDKDTEYKKLKLNLEAELTKKQSELDIGKKLSEDILKLNKEELKLTQTKLERVSWLSPAMFITGLVLGSIFTINVLKVAVEVSK
jgi:hypothetical protein